MSTSERTAGDPSIQSVAVVDNVKFGYAEGRGLFYALRLTPPDWEPHEETHIGWRPGQFVMLRPESWGPEMPWARPLSICLQNKELVMFFQIAGKGTERLARLKSGDMVQIMGPFGTSFAMEPEVPTVLLAGGMGIVPFVGYVHNHPTPWSLTLHFGHRFPIDCYPFENFNEKIIADNYRETCLEDREAFLRLVDEQVAVAASKKGLALACGPAPFLRYVQDCAAKHKARAQLSLERHMACGVGACLGCVVKPRLKPGGKGNASPQVVPEAMHKPEPVPTCTCGPVFWADSIDLSY